MSTENDFLAQKMNRRDFLTLSALGVLPCMLTACLAGTPFSGSVSPTPDPSIAVPSPSPTRPPTPTDADWKMLASSLQGTLVRPGSPQYPTAIQLFQPSFDRIKPTAVAYC